MLTALTRLGTRLSALGDELLPFFARLTFAGVLLIYYWNSAATKLGDGLFGFVRPGAGAYVQIFPRATEAVGYDISQLSILHWAVVTAGMWAEFILPLLILLGLLSRLAALGMIGFIVLQSLTDIYGHLVDAPTIGAWFDAASGALILDQRAFWALALLILLFKGAGAVSLDRLLWPRLSA